ncbi:MAG: VWA domain-containing protein [Gomphosphaeria aponina SAG 52.96 = DSM 107014]|uniref:VWA domain-containing protein n=1 Tax=Gomphosphaeria aponina SAG 52.96 = DSM 107014 TaxID=1521640 RepID=A0A941GN49_9CHRO|nr:VWA domain-containing protein [Gomphosphaeria aponina SAG 52.96 = DSM 107014]
MTNICPLVTPGQPLTGWQKTGLELVGNIFAGRDVVLAIDLTESVGLNDEGRLRLRQIIEDTLEKGDGVYVVPFASTVSLPALENPIEFNGKEDIERIIDVIPFQSDLTVSNTDIQLAELFVYQGLAQINQCRLSQNLPIQHQSVVWLTDAPLLTQPGITSDVWIETPADSPFREQNSPASQARQRWLEVLPLQQKRSQPITTNNNQTYQLTIVDIPPTVQEFCTPAPGGKETCLVTPYLFHQLWLPTSIIFLVILCLLGAGGFGLKYLMSINKKWRLKISFEDDREEQSIYLGNNQKKAIGEDIDCPGSEVRGYLRRQGNKLYLSPQPEAASIYYNNKEVTREEEIKANSLRINCPEDQKDFAIVIKIIK